MVHASGTLQQIMKADVMLKSARFLSTSRSVPFSLDLPRTEASCSAFIPCIREVWTKNILQVNIRKIIYLNCEERYQSMIDHRNYTHNLSSCEIKACKKFRPEWVPWPLWYPCSALPTELLGQLGADHVVSLKYIRRTWRIQVIIFPFRPEFFSSFNFTTA